LPHGRFWHCLKDRLESSAARINKSWSQLLTIKKRLPNKASDSFETTRNKHETNAQRYSTQWDNQNLGAWTESRCLDNQLECMSRDSYCKQ
jgi:hypothetical protein